MISLSSLLKIYETHRKWGLLTLTEYTEWQAFYPVVGIGSPHSLTHKRVLLPPPPSGLKGETQSLAGGEGTQFGRWDRHSGTLVHYNSSTGHAVPEDYIVLDACNYYFSWLRLYAIFWTFSKSFRHREIKKLHNRYRQQISRHGVTDTGDKIFARSLKELMHSNN